MPKSKQTVMQKIINILNKKGTFTSKDARRHFKNNKTDNVMRIARRLYYYSKTNVTGFPKVKRHTRGEYTLA